MGRARLQLANQLQEKGYLTINPNDYKFTWIESFPLFTPDEQGIRTWQATHHPFTAPYDEDIPLLATDPSKVRGQHYDLVLNGMEIGGGSIRIHSPVMQTFIFEKILEVRKKGKVGIYIYIKMREGMVFILFHSIIIVGKT